MKDQYEKLSECYLHSVRVLEKFTKEIAVSVGFFERDWAIFVMMEKAMEKMSS